MGEVEKQKMGEPSPSGLSLYLCGSLFIYSVFAHFARIYDPTCVRYSKIGETSSS